MPLNKIKVGGQMYQFLNEMSGGNGYTWNTVKGFCPHQCSYCYAKRYYNADHPQPKIHFDEKELKTDLGTGNFIFVGSSCDMLAEGIDQTWIIKTIKRCLEFENRYLFQTKNPFSIFHRYSSFLPENSVIGTTIESDMFHPEMGNAPAIPKRARNMNELAKEGFETMVTIEPIMEFNMNGLLPLIGLCRPSWVNIGADSGGHNLPEPPKEKVLELISELRKFTEIKLKPNLARIIGKDII